jgi:hypothetical protein
MSDLVERIEKAVMETWVCGIEIDGVRMLCCDERAKGRPGYWKPEDCHCRNSARAAMAIVLEEAAKVAESYASTREYKRQLFDGDEITTHTCHVLVDPRKVAAAIRKLGEE